MACLGGAMLYAAAQAAKSCPPALTNTARLSATAILLPPSRCVHVQYVTTNPSDKSLLRELQALLQQQFDEAHARKGPLDRLTERIRNGNGGMSNSTL